MKLWIESEKGYARIHAATRAEDWFHFPGHQNPADLISRGTTIAYLVGNEFMVQRPVTSGSPNSRTDHLHIDLRRQCFTNRTASRSRVHGASRVQVALPHVAPCCLATSPSYEQIQEYGSTLQEPQWHTSRAHNARRHSHLEDDPECRAQGGN